MLLLFFSGVNGFFYPLFFRWWNFSFTSTFRYIFPTCGKLLRYATLLRLLVSFYFVFPAFQIFCQHGSFHIAPIKKEEGKGGGIEDASALWGRRLFFVPLTPLSLFFSIFVVIPLNKLYLITRICLYSKKYLLSK